VEYLGGSSLKIPAEKPRQGLMGVVSEIAWL